MSGASFDPSGDWTIVDEETKHNFRKKWMIFPRNDDFVVEINVHAELQKFQDFSPTQTVEPLNKLEYSVDKFKKNILR